MNYLEMKHHTVKMSGTVSANMQSSDMSSTIATEIRLGGNS